MQCGVDRTVSPRPPRSGLREELAAAARLVAPLCDGVCLNLGCPQWFAERCRLGAFLLDDEDLCARLVAAMAAAVPGRAQGRGPSRQLPTFGRSKEVSQSNLLRFRLWLPAFRGYPSQLVAAGRRGEARVREDPRAGRWRGRHGRACAAPRGRRRGADHGARAHARAARRGAGPPRDTRCQKLGQEPRV